MTAIDHSPVTWSELYVVAGLIVGAGVAVAGFTAWLWRVISALRSELTDFREKVAENYATTQAVIQVESRIEAALNRLVEQFERGFDRVIQLIHANAADPPHRRERRR